MVYCLFIFCFMYGFMVVAAARFQNRWRVSPYLRTAYFEHYQVLPNLRFHLEMKNAHAFLPCELGIIWNSVFNRKQNKIYIALKN